MKTLSQILDEVQDGGKPDYDDLRYALIAMKALHHFDSRALRELWSKEEAGKYRRDLFGLKYQAEQSFRRFKTALEIPPKQYVGHSHDPDTEECQKWNRLSKAILQQVIESPKNPS